MALPRSYGRFRSPHLCRGYPSPFLSFAVFVYLTFDSYEAGARLEDEMGFSVRVKALAPGSATISVAASDSHVRFCQPSFLLSGPA